MDDRVPNEPAPLLEYASARPARASVPRILGGLVAALFLLIAGLFVTMMGVAFATEAMKGSRHERSVPWAFVGGVLAIAGLSLIICGAIQTIASFADMWNPLRYHVWDRWFITIGTDE